MDSEHTQLHPAEAVFTSNFIRERNLLLTSGSMKAIFDSYEAHWSTNDIAPADEVAALFRSALAAFTLHTASRPRRQVLAWTLNFQDPLCNLFLCGDTDDEVVAGRFFDEGIAQAERNSFYQEVSDRGKPVYRSFVDFSGSDPLLAAEEYYARSEQRPARFFQLSEYDFAILTAHPDWDRQWFRSVQQDEIAHIEDNAELGFIEKRALSWHCGCDQKKVLGALESVFHAQADELFAGDDSITVNCPRCSSRYIITREALEAYVAEQAESEQSTGEQ
ncbi:Hsp33 family molecular chaperone HslO [Rubellicoccus peritrichatus]|uniref:Hsp33 family molecular chaperone HslO n=1 Tax=Rubellicoccus peritrichatus TaxID=3080537 RepID=A0AAQ3QSY5_9BACT|nr:Hsp33 family molecular chaperone HslO [Puniceicoccus sp. CR14]WOO43103.1 Hsp33 family molecular chaperone HslO [Puniceicoccus sp. CR14]